MYTKEQMKVRSVTGNRSNRAKDKDPKQKMSPQKLEVILGKNLARNF